jgi:hypothetical protein
MVARTAATPQVKTIEEAVAKLPAEDLKTWMMR